MTLKIQIPEVSGLHPKIAVFGVGGAGCNAVNNMINKDLEGVNFIIANTDAQALQGSNAQSCIQLGVKITKGLGAGARPDIGASAAEESIEEVIDHLSGCHMCFITAGMGGGTGTGAAPVIAQTARELGVLTVGVVTKPFQFEGSRRMRQAEQGAIVLQKVVDTLIVIPNQNLFRIANEKTTFTEAFALADDVLYHGVKSVTDLIIRPGVINLDFADIRSVMSKMGKAMMGTGEASGEERAKKAAEKAIANPLLDEIALNGSKSVLINVTGGVDLTLFEMDEATNFIKERVDSDAQIIVGATLDKELEGTVRVSVVATGIDINESEQGKPKNADKTQPSLRGDFQFSKNKHTKQTNKQNNENVAHSPTKQKAAVQADHMVGERNIDMSHVTDPLPLDDQTLSTVDSHSTKKTDANTVTPSPEEIMQCLKKAVNKKPQKEEKNIYSEHPKPKKPPSAPHAKRRPKGFRDLIARMRGNSDTAKRQRPPSSIEDNYSAGYEDSSDNDEKVKVPAFLRRQAN